MANDYLEVRNWGKYQHRRTRRDPWFKCHYEIIDPRANPDIFSLSLPSRYLAFAVLCLAAKTENLIPDNATWLGTEAGMTTSAARKALRELKDIGFVRSVTVNGTIPGTEVGTKSDENGTTDGTSRIERIQKVLGAKAPRTRDVVWDTLEELFGPAPRGTDAHGKRIAAVRDLKKFGATADSIRYARKRWDRVFEGATPTDKAIANHYGRLTLNSTFSPGTSAPPPCSACGIGAGLHAADCPTQEEK